MNINVQLTDTNSQIGKKILKALLPDIQKYMDKALKIIKTELPSILIATISSSPEYDSLINGKLKYEFGIPNASQKIASLLNVWSSNIEIQYFKPSIVANQIKSNFSVQLVKADFSDVLYTDYAFMQDNLRGYDLPWLQWLLLSGDVIIIQNHEIILGPSPYSRTGNAIMKQNKGRTWKVPSEYSGTINDNWITRSIERAAPQIDQLLQRAIKL